MLRMRIGVMMRMRCHKWYAPRPMRGLRFSIICCVLLFLFALPFAAFAAEQNGDPALRQLYISQITAKSPSPSVENRITAERARVRNNELKKLSEMVDAANKEQGTAPDSTATAFAQQRALVDKLTALRQEAQVDHDLLDEEEAGLNGDATDSAGPAMEEIRRGKADLLSRRAVLEERLSAIDETLVQQKDRLNRLSAQGRAKALIGVVQVGVYVGIFILIIVCERFIRRQLFGRIADRNRRYLAMKVFTGVVYIGLLGWVVYRVAADYPGIVTSFAIVGAGIAVALQAVIKDIVGWIVIMQKRLFTLGQRVTIGAYTGDVADISLLRTTIAEAHNTQNSDVGRVGQMVHLPNSMVLDQPVMNFHATSDFMETEMPVTVTVDSDWRKAEEILKSILRDEVGQFLPRARLQHTRRTAYFFASQEPPDPRVFVDITNDGVRFALRFSAPIGQRRVTVTRISREILARFAAAEPAIWLKVAA